MVEKHHHDAASAMVDAPLAPEDRFITMDVLRGFAVMAIFLVNIKAMAMPFGYYMNSSLWGTDLDLHIATLQKFLIDDRWRTIFTVLFGAGMVLISEKSLARGAVNSGARLRWRNFWLMMFGVWHMLLIWSGDILFLYSLAGFLAMGFRHMKLGKLTFWASLILVIGTLWAGLMSMAPSFDATFAAKMGGEMWGTDPEAVQKQIEAMQGSVLMQIEKRATDAVGFVLFYMVLGGFLAITVGLMLWGMVLFKSGFLVGRWSAMTLILLTVAGLGAASALEWVQVSHIKASGYDFGAASQVMPLSIVDGYFGALGFASLILLLMKMGLRFAPVADVGRMAFTNYIACSLIGTTLAGGHSWGLGWYGDVSLAQLMVVCVVTFVAMLIWSSLWLSLFRFGPLEWLWRSLTYGRIQPFRR